MTHYEQKSFIPVTSEELFAWHARPGALERLSPPWDPIRHPRAAAMESGSRATLGVRVGPLVVPWVAEHTEVRPPHGFKDVQISGPFASWEHTHRFEAAPGGSWLVDELDYELPLGPIGELAAGAAVASRLAQLFRYRHRVTATDLERHARYRAAPRLVVGITGASGLVGAALSAYLTTAGHEVRRFTRSTRGGGIPWDPARGLLEPAAAEGLDAVVHLAGETIGKVPWDEAHKRRVMESRSTGTRNLCEALAGLERPPRVFVGASATGFYGDRGSESLTEASEAGRGFLASVVQAWEAAAEPMRRVGSRVCHLRFGIVLDPRGGALARLLPAFRAGLGGPLGSGEQYWPWIVLDDLLAILESALVESEWEGPFNAVSPEPSQVGEVSRELARVLHRPAVLPVPALALRLLLGEMADEMLLASTRAEPARLLEHGFTFRYPELGMALAHVLGEL